MTFVAAIRSIDAITVLSIAREAGQVARRRGIGGLKESIDIGKVGVGDCLRSKGRHFAGGLADVSREIGKRSRRRSERRTDGALAFGSMTCGAHVRGEGVFAFLGAARGRVWIRCGAGLGKRKRREGG